MEHGVFAATFHQQIPNLATTSGAIVISSMHFILVLQLGRAAGNLALPPRDESDVLVFRTLDDFVLHTLVQAGEVGEPGDADHEVLRILRVLLAVAQGFGGYAVGWMWPPPSRS